MSVPADHIEIAALRRARDAVRSGQAIPPADRPWMVGFLDRVLAGADLDEAIGIQTAPGDHKEPHSIEDMLEKLNSTVQRMAEQMSRFAGQRPGVAAPLLALSSNELSSHLAAMEIGVDQQTIRNWLHKNPNLGCFRDGRWIVFRDMLENYSRARFPDAADRKLSR